MAKPKPAPAKTETSTELPKPTRVRRLVSPELAASVREEDETLAATVQTANAMVAAVVAENNRVIHAAKARHAAAHRTVLRSLGIDDDARFIAVDGFGTKTMVEIELSAAREAVTNG